MARCEDYPCCGHELGCCPDFDDDGRQLNMKCVCGATVSINSSSSLCNACLRRGDGDDPFFDEGSFFDDGDDDFDDDNDDFDDGR